jgi:hypothetical protein
MILGLMIAAGRGPASEPILTDPALVQLSKLVGGHWEGNLGGAKVNNRFHFAAGGLMVKGEGVVTLNGKTVLYTQPNMGWDASTKSVFYVDFHNHNQVMMGHVTARDGWLLFEFGDMTNPKARFSARSKLTDKNTYEFDIPAEHESFTLHRITN